jgi:hypothetical protein
MLFQKNTLFKRLLGAVFIILTGCAVVQNPQGGDRDELPPEPVMMMPTDRTTNFSAKKITIEFDEYVKLNNAYKEVSFSPEIEPKPLVRATGRKVEVKLNDSIKPNTTYTINFGNSIVDVTESNPLKNFKYVFSTGDFIDSMKITGKVEYVIDTNSTKEVIVGLYPTERSMFFGKKPIIYTQTNSKGEFVLENIKEENYQIYAFKDLNSNKMFDEDELLGFLSDSISLFKDTSNVVLTLAKQVPEKLRIIDKKYYEGRITLKLNYPEDSLYFNVLSPQNFKDSIIVDRMSSDSLYIWLPTCNFDSTKIEVRNNKNWIDTVYIRNFVKTPKMAPVKIEDNLRQPMLRPGNDFKLIFSRIIQNIDTSKIELKEDTIRKYNFNLTHNPKNLREYIFKYDWDTTKQYTISVNENELKDMYDNPNVAYKKSFTVDSAANYGTVILNFTIPKGKQYIAQILTEKNVFIGETLIDKNEEYYFDMVPPNKYLIRYIEDTNHNGKWDIGDVRHNIQPETITYYKDVIMVRKNWDIEVNINIE